MSLAVKLDVIRRTEEAGERQIDVCKALGLAGSTVQCIFKNEDKIKNENGKKRANVQLYLDSFFFKQKGVAWHPSKRDLLFKLNKYFSWSWQGKMLHIVMFIKFMSLLCVLLIVNLILVLKHTSC
jgi:Fe-S cluster biosynthesis and repair protein YggX